MLAVSEEQSMRTSIQSTIQKTACSTLLLLSALSAAGQGTFQNLGFEDTTLLSVLMNDLSGFYITNATIPGWSWSPLFNPGLTDPNTTVGYNTITMDAPAVTLHGTGDRYGYPAIQGNYSVLLQGGSSFVNPQYGGASIFQTGQIPMAARSLTYWASPRNSFQVTFGGNALSILVVSNTPAYTVYGADISAYAGQTGELRFSVPWLGGGILDEIQFSNLPIPEPGILGLSALAALVFGSYTFKKACDLRR
jgi:hypothetical protein